ncbi:MAG: hypothetical protein Q8T08_26195, partial [Ignavibacteria bacterium]|nr:hypothetical protein [Ignavibacteria bacterium]
DVSIDQEINELDVPIILSNENNSMDANVSSMQFLSDKNGIIVIYDIEKIIDSSIALHIQDVLEKS